MCLMAIAVDAHPEYRLVLAMNRDERYARSTAPAAEWEDPPGIIGGRDLLGGGTWLGVTRSGRFGAVTNFHETLPPPADAPSRGGLITDYLMAEDGPLEYLESMAPSAARYAGFNLLVGDSNGVFWFSNRSDRGPVHLVPGFYGLSNHLLDTPWPKVVRARQEMRRLISEDGDLDPAALLDMMHHREPLEAAEGGPGTEFERALSASFIVTPEYGTRATTVIMMRRRGGGLLVERTHDRGSAGFSEVRIDL